MLKINHERLLKTLPYLYKSLLKNRTTKLELRKIIYLVLRDLAPRLVAVSVYLIKIKVLKEEINMRMCFYRIDIVN